MAAKDDQGPDPICPAWIPPVACERHGGRAHQTHRGDRRIAGAQHAPTACQIDLAMSLSLFFCTLPVEVFGSSAKTTWRGTL